MTMAGTCCRECGNGFRPRAGAGFCSTKCRAEYNNRRQLHGADLFDLVMSWRFDRANAKAAGALSLLCRMAAAFRAQDKSDRAGRKSWQSVSKVRERNVRLIATVVGYVAGRAGGRSKA